MKNERRDIGLYNDPAKRIRGRYAVPLYDYTSKLNSSSPTRAQLDLQATRQSQAGYDPYGDYDPKMRKPSIKY